MCIHVCGSGGLITWMQYKGQRRASDPPELELQAKCELSRVSARTLLELLVLQELSNLQATLQLPRALLQLSFTTTEHRQASPDPLWSLGVAVQMLTVVLF